MSNSSPRNLSTWLPSLIGPLRFKADGGDDVIPRKTINFIGATVVDNPDEERTDITGLGGGSAESRLAIDNNGSGNLDEVDTTSSGTAVEVIRFLGTAPNVRSLLNGASRDRALVLLAVNDALTITAAYSAAPATDKILTGAGDFTVPQGAGVALFYDKTTQVWRTIGAPGSELGWYNVLDYGAKADGLTDNTAAFTAAIQAAGARNPQVGGLGAPPSTAPFSGVVYLPPAAGKYYFASDLHITRQVELRGPGGTLTNHGPAYLLFAAGKGIFTDDPRNTTESFGGASGTIIRNLTIELQPLTLPVRANLTAYVAGDKVRLANDNRFYYECIVGGTTAASSPFGGDTLSGQADFTASAGRQRRETAVTTVDGTVTWACKAACGVLVATRTKILECNIIGATNFAIGTFAEEGYSPHTNANGSHFEGNYIENCGCGIHVGYGDGNNVKVLSNSFTNVGGNYSGSGGFGIVDAAFLGAHIVGNDLSGGGSGRGIWAVPGTAGDSYYSGNHVEEWGFASWYGSGILGGGAPCEADPLSPHTGYNSPQGAWGNIRLGRRGNKAKSPLVWAEHQDFGFNLRLNDDDPGFAYIAERYYTAAGPGLDSVGIGSWVTGSLPSGILAERRVYAITGTGWFTSPQSPDSLGTSGGPMEGPLNFRIFHGYFAGNGTAPFYHGLDGANSKTDTLVRRDTPGVGGHRLVGDLFDHISDGGGFAGGADTVGQICYAAGWEAQGPWSAGMIGRNSFDQLAWAPSTAVHPTTPNGYTYACSRTGVAHASVEPTWPTTFLTDATHPTGGILPVVWSPHPVRKVGDYGAPTVRNGHYYKVTAVVSADIDGYARGGSAEPAWPTGSGATIVDGNLTWTEQGSDVGTYVDDGTTNPTQWTCIGRAPQYRNHGTRTWVPYNGGEATEVVVGYYDTDGTTLRKLVNVTSGALASLGDAAKDLEIDAANLSLVTGGTLSISASQVVCPFFGGNAALESQRANINTANATITDLFTFTIPTGASQFIAEILATRADSSHAASFGRKCLFRNNGAAIFQGTVIDTGSESGDLAGLTITIDLSGTTGRLRVTGLAGTSINWDAVVTLIQH